MMEKEINEMCEKASERLDKAIIRTFKRMGYEFKYAAELEQFVFDFCKIKDGNGIKEIFIKGEKIFSFETEIKTEWKGNKVKAYYKFKAYK